MPATALTVTDCSHKWSQVGAVVTMAAADAANGNKFVVSTDALLIVHNTGASSRTVTITSEALSDYYRTGDVSALSIAAGQYRVFRLTRNGWAASSPYEISLSANHAEVKFGVVDLTKQV